MCACQRGLVAKRLSIARFITAEAAKGGMIMHRPFWKTIFSSFLIALFILLSYPQTARASNFMVKHL